MIDKKKYRYPTAEVGPSNTLKTSMPVLISQLAMKPALLAAAGLYLVVLAAYGCLILEQARGGELVSRLLPVPVSVLERPAYIAAAARTLQ